MTLPIRIYGDPVLRKKGDRIEKITPEIRQLVSDMLETMHAESGVGLAAQQVGYALQLAVVDIRGSERPSTMEMDGKQVDPVPFMPLVLINPEITPVGPETKDVEGCLSFPEIYAEISRPESVLVKATTDSGNPILFKCSGLLARAIQHEVDHLNGILFIDRMDSKTRNELRDELEELRRKTLENIKSKQK